MDQLHFGVYAIDLSSGQTLFSHNAHRKFIPASNQKILVSAAAISLLGPEYRLETSVGILGETFDSFVDGDIVVVGSGDPTFSDRYWAPGSQAVQAIADSLYAHGIRHVGGSLVVDVAAWDSATVGPTWEVEDLRHGYASTGGAFAIDEGELELIVSAGSTPSEPAGVTWSPIGTSDFVRSELKTAPKGTVTSIRADYLPESRVIVLRGKVGAGTVDTLSIAMRDPVRQSVAALAREIQRAGIEIEGGWRVQWPSKDMASESCTRQDRRACSGVEQLFSMWSPPMSDIVAGILKPSQNWMTEQVVRVLGQGLGGGGSWEEGLGVVEKFLVEEVGVHPSDLYARDGSGLSFYNLVTPRAIVSVLTEVHNSQSAAVFRGAMPTAGEEGSTLEHRLEGLEGRVRAKTGTISNVNSLSGYLVRGNGEEVAFSILSNGSGMPASRVRSAIDEIVRALAR
jgi:D-alanyl-D-alanine carboxypeptidase/D-alanyl-D-alanine-endopeptidase (penicillin-binding protein 4)